MYHFDLPGSDAAASPAGPGGEPHDRGLAAQRLGPRLRAGLRDRAVAVRHRELRNSAPAGVHRPRPAARGASRLPSHTEQGPETAVPAAAASLVSAPSAAARACALPGNAFRSVLPGCSSLVCVADGALSSEALATPLWPETARARRPHHHCDMPRSLLAAASCAGRRARPVTAGLAQARCQRWLKLHWPKSAPALLRCRASLLRRRWRPPSPADR